MKRFASLFLRAAMALAFVLGPGASPALAGPVYHVAIDTGSLSGQGGYLDFLLMGLDNAAPVQATISNVAGRFDGASFTVGAAAGSVASGVTLDNSSGWTEFGQWAQFGGVFSFDIGFDTGAGFADGIGAGTSLSVALLDASLNYLGTAGDVATFSLQPGQDDVVVVGAGFASVEANAVPEPSTAWLGAAGLLLLTGMARRRTLR